MLFRSGCGIATSARLTIRGGSVSYNVAAASTGCYGTGIMAWTGANVALRGNVQVRGNDAGTGDGAGIAVHNGARLALYDTSTVAENTTTGSGGGIHGACDAILSIEGAQGDHVHDNTPDDVVKLLC